MQFSALLTQKVEVRDAVANAMARGLPMELVADVLTLPIDTVKQIAEQLKAEAAASL